jgi:hypothetical protein
LTPDPFIEAREAKRREEAARTEIIRRYIATGDEELLSLYDAQTPREKQSLESLKLFNQILTTENRASRRGMLRASGRGLIKGWRFFRTRKPVVPPTVATPKVTSSQRRAEKRAALELAAGLGFWR